ncbi:MAG TPA: polysaccharide biosynthesis protein [Pyrinomonadaceae bacterium]|nr:polysaccharide biosynthesis protein [Pyrinomonadaceae bacterium]
MNPLEGKRILVTGGTGSLGQTLVRRLLSGEMGRPAQITVFSRDEAKQHYMRLDYLHKEAATDDVIYQNSQDLLNFRIGDVRDYSAVVAATRQADVVFNAAALKQVPSCEYFPYEAVQTNIDGAQNIVRAIRENRLPVELVVGISTDKACKPINVMGMTKALQERIFIEANRDCIDTRLMCVRYGNVIASRGSIVPLFVEQIRNGKPLTVTLPEMTRFLLSLDKAVDTIFAAINTGNRGETYVPQVASAKMIDVAKALMGDKDLPIVFTGIRPGEKVHEIMVSEEECFRTEERNGFYSILPVLPELRVHQEVNIALAEEYSSKDNNLPVDQLRILLGSADREIAAYMSA